LLALRIAHVSVGIAQSRLRSAFSSWQQVRHPHREWGLLMRVEQIGRATLYNGDCREVIPTLTGVDAVVTDPPYGVGLGSDPTHIIGNRPYESFDDTPENIAHSVVPAVNAARAIASRCVVTPGTRCAWLYDAPDELGAVFFPAGAGFSRWSFTCSQPILFYGKDPFMPMNKKPNSVRCTETSEKNGHPCPKPIGLMKWLVNRATLDGETILDPFMGSGTTGVAAVQMGRSFIGIEREPKYFDIACRRIEDSQRQGDFFVEAA
jgi:site-specific DNA-methyltransferase (adenine-specific)